MWPMDDDDLLAARFEEHRVEIDVVVDPERLGRLDPALLRD